MEIPIAHSFVISGLGELEIVPSASKHNYYNPSSEVKYDFSVLTLNQKQDYQPFHFFEWQKILFNAVFNTNDKFKAPFSLIVNEGIKHQSKKMNNIDILSCYFSFENQVGQTSIKIVDARNQTVFKLNTEVFPQKMDYKSDYRMMMAEISDIIQNLAYALLKDTFQKAKPRPEGHTTENEWWNILDRLFENFMLCMAVIKRQPKHDIIREEIVAPVNRIKKASVKNHTWFQRNSKYALTDQGFRLPSGQHFTHALATHKYTSYDTYENRFVVYAAKQSIDRLNSYKKEIEKQAKSKDYRFLIGRINRYQGEIYALLQSSPFNEVSAFEKRAYFSTTLTKGAGYRDFLQIFLLLSKGLEILQNDIFKIEQKNISTLYEYWCFLSLIKIIQKSNKLDIVHQDIIKINAGRFSVELKSGKESRIRFRNTHNEEIEIFYNREFKRNHTSFTYNQKPDHAISFYKSGYKNPFWFIFDAKYRFVENSDSDSFDAPDDAIGQLHRYRDAILHSEVNTGTYRSAIKNLGGIILYPYPLSEELFTKNKFYKSIGKVNIGAMPFLPGKTKLVSDYLLDLLTRKTPEEHFEEFIEMDYHEYRHKQSEFTEWITIGVIKSSNQQSRLDYLTRHNIHYIPYVKETSTRIYNTTKMLITVAGKDKAQIREVLAKEIMNKSELKDTGITWNLNHEKYIVFLLNAAYDEIGITKDIIPVNFRYTTAGALSIYNSVEGGNAKTLYMTNPSAYRLFNSLQRMETAFDLSWGPSKTDFSEIIFNVSGLKIKSSESFKPQYFEIENKMIKIHELLNLIKNQTPDS